MNSVNSITLQATRRELSVDSSRDLGGSLEAVGPVLSQSQFDFFRNLAKTHAGIALADYKLNMVQRRVSKRLRVLQLDDFASYANYLQSRGNEAEIEHFINTLTTNKTDFFREKHHFEHMSAVALPELSARAGKTADRKIRVWSAGCSSGQEPYTIAMTMAEAQMEPAKWDAKILATDIDTEMVEAGRAGIYPWSDVQVIPQPLRMKYVEPPGRSEECGRMSSALRSLITFNPLNLHGAWPMKGKFDIIFCRNVIIYFDKPSQCLLFDRFANQMKDGGWLYIGHSESLYKVTERFRQVGQSIYQKVC